MRAADAALQSPDEPAPAGAVVIDQLIGAELGYRVVVSDKGSSLTPRLQQDARQADAVFSQSLETAKAIALGRSDAHRSFLLGEIEFRGNIETIISQRDVFDWLEKALSPVMAITDFDDE